MCQRLLLFVPGLSLLLFLKGNAQQLIFEENFADNNNGWYISTEDYPVKSFITTGDQYYFDLPTNNSERWGFGWIGLPSKINELFASNDYLTFTINFKIRSVGSYPTTCFGLVFSQKVTSTCPGGDFYLIGVRGAPDSDNCLLYLSERKNCQWVNTALADKRLYSYKPGDFNRLTIQKSKNSYSIYLNDDLAYTFKYEDKMDFRLYIEQGSFLFDYVKGWRTTPATNPVQTEAGDIAGTTAPDSGGKDADTGWTAPATDQLLIGKNFALIIGVGAYNDKSIQDLSRPAKDADSLRAILLQRYRFNKADIISLKNPTKVMVEDTLSHLSKIVGEDDNLLIFYSGHNAYFDDTGLSYWYLSDAVQGKLSSYLSSSVIRDYLVSIKAKHILLIADACFSGAIFKSAGSIVHEPNKAIRELYKLKSRTAMTSSNMELSANESIFFNHLKDALKGNDRNISARQLFAIFSDAVINDNPHDKKNIPQYGSINGLGHFGGDYIFFVK